MIGSSSASMPLTTGPLIIAIYESWTCCHIRSARFGNPCLAPAMLKTCLWETHQLQVKGGSMMGGRSGKSGLWSVLEVARCGLDALHVARIRLSSLGLCGR